MSDKRTMQEEIVKQCEEHFTRETKFCERQSINRKEVTNEEFTAKQRIVEQILATGASAAMKSGQNGRIEAIEWEFREVEL